MLGSFDTGAATMRILLLTLALVGVAAPAAAATQRAAPPVPACHVNAPQLSPEPPAWLLLLGALVLVGAGRLAAR